MYPIRLDCSIATRWRYKLSFAKTPAEIQDGAVLGGVGDQDERMFPSRPNRPSDYPEELIEEAETWARMPTLERDELLTQSEILKKEASPLAKEADQHPEAEPDEAKHGQDL